MITGYLVGRPFVKRFALYYGTVVCPVSLSCLSVCSVGVLRPNGRMDQDAIWYGRRPRPRPNCVRWGVGDPAPPTERGTAPPTFRSPISATVELIASVPVTSDNNSKAIQDGDS